MVLAETGKNILLFIAQSVDLSLLSLTQPGNLSYVTNTSVYVAFTKKVLLILQWIGSCLQCQQQCLAINAGSSGD